MKHLSNLHRSPAVKGILRSSKLKARRETIYKMLSRKNKGIVLCFVCGKPVSKEEATLEHVLEQRNGGSDEMNNLSISHGDCNRNRERIERLAKKQGKP